MSHIKQNLFTVGALAMALPLASLAGQSAFASTPASANGMSGFIYKCTVKNYNEQTGETDTDQLFTEEQLASLKTLNCLDIEYTLGDIQDWSKGLDKLTGLETIHFNSNDFAFMTGNLDLSFAPGLKYAYLQGAKFSSINISQNPDLIAFDATSNELTAINTNDNDGLEYLWLGDNNISEINLDNNPNLKLLFLDNTNIQSLDISTNTQIKSLSVSNTNLTTLDLSNNTKLESLYALNTSINSLNLENNQLLKYLTIDGQTVSSAARATKSDNGYEMDVSLLSNLIFNNTIHLWQPADSEYYEYDEQTKMITFSDIDSVLAEGGITFTAEDTPEPKTFTLSLRPVDIDVIVFVNGEKLPNYSLNDNAKFVGDAWDTEDYTNIINNLYGEELSLYPTRLTSVIARTRATTNGEYTQIGEDFGTDDSAPKLSGTLENIERIALIYNYEIIPTSPETGHSTKQSESNSSSAGIVAILTSISCIAFAIFHIVHRYNKHNKANRS